VVIWIISQIIVKENLPKQMEWLYKRCKTKLINYVIQYLVCVSHNKFRISDQIKLDIDQFKGKVDWNHELRQFIESRIDEKRKIELL
jgi:hypothetical protein